MDSDSFTKLEREHWLDTQRREPLDATARCASWMRACQLIRILTEQKSKLLTDLARAKERERAAYYAGKVAEPLDCFGDYERARAMERGEQ